MNFDPNQADDYESIKMIETFKNSKSVVEKLEFVLAILYSLDGEQKEKFDADIIKYEKWKLNMKLMRRIKHRDALVEETPVEYFGKDYIDDPFEYNEQIESAIAKMELELMASLGRVILIKKVQNIFVDDNA